MATGGKKPGKLARAKKAAKTVRKAAKSAGGAAKSAGTAMGRAVKAQGTADNGSAEQIDLAFLRGLIDAVDNSGIDSVEIERDGTKVRISKTPAAAPIVSASAAQHAMVQHAPVQHAVESSAPAPAPAAAASVEEPKSNLVDVKSPMVGTFYRSPAPEAPSYVEVGSQVSKGQTLCILEAMKLMNEMESEVDGIVREILVDNADPVEYGQVLYRIEPTSR